MPSEKMSGHLGVRVAEDCTNLPPGFRFHPTDEELVSYYLKHKVLDGSLFFHAIGQVDFNKCEPWDLPARAKMGESMFYFFSLRDRKYPTGMRTNRATGAGYWKATGKDREVMNNDTGKLVGMKKTLVFYTGRAPKGEKTNWIMHEYRLEGESAIEAHHQEWVVCRIFEKNAAGPNKTSLPLVDNYDGLPYNPESSDNKGSSSSTLPPLQNLEPPSPNSVRPNYTYTGLTLPDPQAAYYHASATIPGQEAILKRSASTARGRRPELQLGDSLDNFVSAWDTYNSSDWTWDVSTDQRQ